MEINLGQAPSETVFSTTMEYTAFDPEPSTDPKSYKLVNASPFTSVNDYNRDNEFEKAEVLFAIKGGEKTFTVVVSNIKDPPKAVEVAEDIWTVLKEGQFWFQLAVLNRFTAQYSFRVRGYERRGDVRLEVEEEACHDHYL